MAMENRQQDQKTQVDSLYTSTCICIIKLLKIKLLIASFLSNNVHELFGFVIHLHWILWLSLDCNLCQMSKWLIDFNITFLCVPGTKSGMSWFSMLALLFAVFGIIIGSLYTVCQENKNELCEQYWKPAETHARVFLANMKTNSQELMKRSSETLSGYYDKYMGKKTTEQKKSQEDSGTKTAENTEKPGKKERAHTWSIHVC